MALAYYARRYHLPVEQKFCLREVGRSTLQAFWALFIPMVIWVGILGGIATATEVAALAVVAALVIGIFIYRKLSARQTWLILKDSVGQTAPVMLIIASSAVLGWFLTSEQVPQKFARMILETADNRYLILFFLNLFFFVAGIFLHSAAAIILIVPIVMPLVREIGVDSIHFGRSISASASKPRRWPPCSLPPPPSRACPSGKGFAWAGRSPWC
jgi:tripartite ATP-independent transporter DctM subunit